MYLLTNGRKRFKKTKQESGQLRLHFVFIYIKSRGGYWMVLVQKLSKQIYFFKFYYWT